MRLRLTNDRQIQTKNHPLANGKVTGALLGEHSPANQHPYLCMHGIERISLQYPPHNLGMPRDTIPLPLPTAKEQRTYQGTVRGRVNPSHRKATKTAPTEYHDDRKGLWKGEPSHQNTEVRYPARPESNCYFTSGHTVTPHFSSHRVTSLLSSGAALIWLHISSVHKYYRAQLALPTINYVPSIQALRQQRTFRRLA
jgi:hypothetical protein